MLEIGDDVNDGVLYSVYSKQWKLLIWKTRFCFWKTKSLSMLISLGRYSQPHYQSPTIFEKEVLHVVHLVEVNGICFTPCILSGLKFSSQLIQLLGYSLEVLLDYYLSRFSYSDSLFCSCEVYLYQLALLLLVIPLHGPPNTSLHKQVDCLRHQTKD